MLWAGVTVWTLFPIWTWRTVQVRNKKLTASAQRKTYKKSMKIFFVILFNVLNFVYIWILYIYQIIIGMHWDDQLCQPSGRFGKQGVDEANNDECWLSAEHNYIWKGQMDHEQNGWLVHESMSHNTISLGVTRKSLVNGPWCEAINVRSTLQTLS